MFNMELNDLRKITCAKTFDVSVDRTSVCNVIENFAEHGIHCLSYSYINSVINMLA